MSTDAPTLAPAVISERDRYFFDLHGFIVVRGALSADEVRDCNTTVDRLQHLKPGQWSGAVHGHTYGARDGLNLQQIYESGPAFEKFIDHPGWFDRVRTFVGGEDTFDYLHGPLFIDECFVSVRGPGDAIPMHSGGHENTKRTQFLVRDRRFMCGQINVITALRDVGPGDGATMVIPGSHKANFPHPDIATKSWGKAISMEGVEGAMEVHLKAGDSLIFVDALMHGSAARVNAGQRRLAIFRYGPSWGNFRHGYRPSAELLARLSPLRRKIVQPQGELLMPPQTAPTQIQLAAVG